MDGSESSPEMLQSAVYIPHMITIKLSKINTGAANFSSFCTAPDPEPAIYTFISQKIRKEINNPLNPSPFQKGRNTARMAFTARPPMA